MVVWRKELMKGMISLRIGEKVNGMGGREKRGSREKRTERGALIRERGRKSVSLEG